jgi:hypothetical protein
MLERASSTLQRLKTALAPDEEATAVFYLRHGNDGDLERCLHSVRNRATIRVVGYGLDGQLGTFAGTVISIDNGERVAGTRWKVKLRLQDATVGLGETGHSEVMKTPTRLNLRGRPWPRVREPVRSHVALHHSVRHPSS